jgi:hypothetical protein
MNYHFNFLILLLILGSFPVSINSKQSTTTIYDKSIQKDEHVESFLSSLQKIKKNINKEQEKEEIKTINSEGLLIYIEFINYYSSNFFIFIIL